MNRLHLFAFLSLALLSACGGKPEFETLSGDKGRFEDFRGRWLLINYWAEWCAPCIKEMPELKTFSDTYGQQAVILTVNFDGASGDTLREQVNKLNIEVPVLLADPSPILAIPRPQGLPATYVFDPSGKLITTLNGEQTVASLAAAITPAAQP